MENFHLIYTIFKNHPNCELSYLTEILNFIFKNFTFFSKLFFENFDLILNCIWSEDIINTKLIVDKFSSLLGFENSSNTIDATFNSISVISVNTNTSSCNIILIVPVIAKNFSKIFFAILNSGNEELIQLIITKFELFADYFSPPAIWPHLSCSSWLEISNFFKTLAQSESIFDNVDFLLKVHPFTFNLIKQADTGNNEAFANMNSIAKNYKVIKQAFKVLALVMKYASKATKEEILKYLEKEVVGNKSFYKRRYYFSFFKKSLEILSVSFLKENGLVDNLLKFLSDLNLFTKNSLKYVREVFPLIYDDAKIKSIIENKLDKIRGGNNDFESQKVNFTHFL